MTEVAIIGKGIIKAGELWDDSFIDLAVKAGTKAIEDAGISAEQISIAYGGNMAAGRFTGQEHIGAMIADYTGLGGLHIPGNKTEGACASGAIALHSGVMAIKSNDYDMVMVLGVEKMTDVSPLEASDILMGAADEWERMSSITFPGLYALIAHSYMNRYGLTREQLALPSVISHRNAIYNPFAHFHKKITVENVIKSQIVAEPLRILDCSPLSDGAAALILCSAEKAKKFTDTPIYIKASAQANDTLGLNSRRDICALDSTTAASKKALKQARLGLKDIDIAYVHDCFSIGYILALEDIGFAKKGTGIKLIEQGETEIGGKIPINPNGGLKADGHPVGATGVRQVVDAVLQLRGEVHPKIQVPHAKYILTHNVGGTGAIAVIHILSNKR